MVTSAQIRAARHALKLSVDDLSKRCGVSARTIKRMESEDGVPSSTIPNLRAVVASLEAAGIEFIGAPDAAPGIRIHKR